MGACSRDTHFHLNVIGLNKPPYMIDVNKKSVLKLVAAVRVAAEQAKTSDSWIRGGGWQELVMPRVPTAADIDPVSGNHPVVLRDLSGHAMVVNSARSVFTLKRHWRLQDRA